MGASVIEVFALQIDFASELVTKPVGTVEQTRPTCIVPVVEL